MCWDVSTRGNEWNVDDGEELYCIVNVGKLVIHSGASLDVRGNVFSFVCQELEKREDDIKNCDWKVGKDKELPSFDIGLLPTPFSYTLQNRLKMHGKDG